MTRYLLRFDDICPTMNWSVWNLVEQELKAYGVKPILAVIPDNQDSSLHIDAPDERFWERVRAWQEMGWTIALHGHLHVYTGTDAGLVGKARRTEFAGIPSEIQERKLREAVAIFQSRGVRPEVWIAPSHSFDQNTVRIIAELGIRVISDGFFLLPGVDDSGVLWIPQQVTSLRRRPFGVWTACFHTNHWKQQDLTHFCADLRRMRKNISSVPEMIALYRDRRRNVLDRTFEPLWRLRILGGARVRQLLGIAY